MRKRKLLLIAVLLFAASVGIGSTLAYLTDSTAQIVNTLLPGTVPPSVQEEFDGTVKQNVRVRNDGNISAYIRAYAVISWKDGEGNLAPEQPVAGRDYTIEWSDSGWKKEGAYFYCLHAVDPGEMTPVLIRQVIQKENRDGYDLVVEIVAQTIQSEGTDHGGKKPIELTWNVTIANGVLRPAAGEGDRP